MSCHSAPGVTPTSATWNGHQQFHSDTFRHALLPNPHRSNVLQMTHSCASNLGCRHSRNRNRSRSLNYPSTLYHKTHNHISTRRMSLLTVHCNGLSLMIAPLQRCSSIRIYCPESPTFYRLFNQVHPALHNRPRHPRCCRHHCHLRVRLLPPSHPQTLRVV